MPLLFEAKNAHRRAGDAHRNAREWELAAQSYRRHLEKRPDDAGIWVQLGHAEKEGGRLDEAEQAYMRAIAISPEDPDPKLHLAHLLKQQGRSDDAFQEFRRLQLLKPDLDTIENVMALSTLRRHRAAVVVGEGAMLFVLQDYFTSLDAHTTTTGIQRVQAGIVLAAMADPMLDAHFIVNDEDGRDEPRFLRIEAETLRAIVDYTGGEVVDGRVLKSLLLEARASAIPIEPGTGSLIIILGAFWGLGNGVERYLSACASGARLAVYVYDLIPITHPEYCELNLSNAFWRALAELLRVVDMVLTISDHTRTELQKFLSEQGGRQVPMMTVPLAHSLGSLTVSSGSWPRSLVALKSKRYVAYVSTIEGRKNHVYVVRAWQRLIEQGVAVPDLVFVGRKGWKIDELTELLERTAHLGGRVHIVHGLSDSELDAIYTRALFTVFTSVVEGWGLPVGESLMHGVPCAASRNASIPEVGGSLVDYVDIADVDDGVRVFGRLIQDDRYRAERRAEIRKSFAARSWADVGADFIIKLRAIAADLPAHALIQPVSLAEGAAFHPAAMLGVAEPVSGYFADPLGLLLAPSFYEADAGGAWMRGAIGQIAFRAATPGPGERFVVLLSLTAAPWAVGHRCSVEIAGDPVNQRRWITLMRGDNFVRLEGTLPTDRICALTIVFEGQAQRPVGDMREFAIGLRALGYCALNQSAMRHELREQLFFS